MVAPEIKSEAAMLVQEFCGLGVCWLNFWILWDILVFLVCLGYLIKLLPKYFF